MNFTCIFNMYHSNQLFALASHIHIKQGIYKFITANKTPRHALIPLFLRGPQFQALELQMKYKFMP